MGAGAAAHRSRRGRGPRGRAGRRRRRLSRQALLVRGAVGSPARARAARRSRATGGAGGGQPSARSRDAARLARPGGDRAVLQGVRAARGVPAPSGRGAEPPRPARARLGHRLREPLERGRRLRALPAREGRDRKSTRLNSSHTVISYAVFCLKKKKKKKKRKNIIKKKKKNYQCKNNKKTT